MSSNTVNIKQLQAEFLSSPKDFIEKADSAYHASIKKIAHRLAFNDDRRDVLLLSGPTSSGKSTSANLIRKYLLQEGIESIAMSTDDFFFDREEMEEAEGEVDLEASTIVNERLLCAKISELLEYGEAYLPSFDFVSGKKVYKDKKDTLGKKGIIIVEGIHALNKQVVDPESGIDTVRVYISVASDISVGEKIVSGRDLRFARRSVRDSKFRGASFIQSAEMWGNVCAGEDKNITPYISSADYIVDTFLAYEPFMLKADFMHLYNEAKASGEDVSAGYIQDLVKLYNECIEGDTSIIPGNSIIREFVGGGIYG